MTCCWSNRADGRPRRQHASPTTAFPSHPEKRPTLAQPPAPESPAHIDFGIGAEGLGRRLFLVFRNKNTTAVPTGCRSGQDASGDVNGDSGLQRKAPQPLRTQPPGTLSSITWQARKQRCASSKKKTSFGFSARLSGRRSKSSRATTTGKWQSRRVDGFRHQDVDHPMTLGVGLHQVV